MPSPPSLHGYHYVRDIGTGGSSCVYLYEQSITERLVAVKVGTRLLNDAGAQDRFRTEASAMARIADHPGILSIYDAGITSDSHGYLVLEYAANGTFAHPPHDMRPDTEQLLSVAITLCSALQTAHAHGILHRDIKPSNILISDARTPLLADFGIASSLYSFSSIPGYSVAWAPPEVLRGTDLHTAGESSDIYSLAASLVGILTGSSPYELAYGPHNKAQLAEYIRTRQLPPFSHMGVPSFLEPALSQALAFDPNERYYSALDFARALQRTQQRTYGCQTPVIVRGSVPYASSNDEILSTPQQLPSTATLLAPVNGNRSNTPPTKNSSRRKSPSVISHTST
jgi:serine/threonine protein kinase